MAAGFCLVTFVAASASEGMRPDFRAAVQKARECVVLVESRVRAPGGPGPEYVMVNTGFFATGEGHVLTSLLAVSGSTRIRVERAGGDVAQAQLWALDQRSGLALLRTGLEHTVSFEPSKEAPEPGAWVLTACAGRCPEGEADVAVAPGVLSSSQACVKLSGVRWDGLLRVELPPRTGLASGPVLDHGGHLVGVVLGARTPPDASGGGCFALPAKALDPILADLIQGRSRRVGWLGLAVACSPGMEGLTVRGVLSGSPAHAGGVRPGDVLLAMDGDVIRTPGVFEAKVSRMAPGARVELQVLRGQELKTVSVEVGARPLLISSMSPRTRREVSWSGLLSPTGPADFGLYGTDQGLVWELRLENWELRQRIDELEQRLELLEGPGSDR